MANIDPKEIPEVPEGAKRYDDDKYTVFDATVDRKHCRWRYTRKPYELVRFLIYKRKRGGPPIASWTKEGFNG